ncbi:MAG: hypothetical protein ACE14S_07910 [Candidatus Bathyarchaeia archaeon]
MTGNNVDGTIMARAVERLPHHLREPMRSDEIQALRLLYGINAVLREKGLVTDGEMERCLKAQKGKELARLVEEEKKAAIAKSERIEKIEAESWKEFKKHVIPYLYGGEKLQWHTIRNGKTVEALIKKETIQGVSSEKILTDCEAFISELSRYDNFGVRCDGVTFLLRVIP